MHPNIKRRRLLQTGAVTLLGGMSLLTKPVYATLKSPDRTLTFHSLHTAEKLTATYWSAGEYVRDGLSEIQHILRDWRANQVHPIDPALLDLLFDLRQTMHSRAPLEIISGYRSPATCHSRTLD